ncbi:hypothetical protein QUA71_13865 [Microcoleus sp. MON1_C5]|uniref:hypothetical protein n=1 Tax=Microcoleus sp. MON1_C5 TaxID=2818828 RepID=UPI002FD14B6E
MRGGQGAIDPKNRVLHNCGMILMVLWHRLSYPEGVYFHSRRDASPYSPQESSSNSATLKIEEELDATAYGYMGNFMQPCYEGAIVDRLLGQSNICDRYERITQRLFEKKTA